MIINKQWLLVRLFRLLKGVTQERRVRGDAKVGEGAVLEDWKKSSVETRVTVWSVLVKERILRALEHDQDSHLDDDAFIFLTKLLLSIGSKGGLIPELPLHAPGARHMRCLFDGFDQEVVDTTRKSLHNQPLVADCMQLLFNLSVGPLRFEPSGSEQRDGRSYLPSDFVPPVYCDQHVFLDAGNGATSPQEQAKDADDGRGNGPNTPIRPLDEFALGITRGDEGDGVHLLAGGRGAGKSTILNRIKWYCSNWCKGIGPGESGLNRDWRPMQLRFDLGTQFDPKKFTLDLMRETCRGVRIHIAAPPVAWRRSPNFLRHTIGQTGRWCSANWLWLVLVAGGGFVIRLLQQLEVINSDDGPAGIALHASNWIAPLIWVGCMYVLARRARAPGASPGPPNNVLSRVAKSIRKPRDSSPWLIALALVLFVALVGGWWRANPSYFERETRRRLFSTRLEAHDAAAKILADRNVGSDNTADALVKKIAEQRDVGMLAGNLLKDHWRNDSPAKEFLENLLKPPPEPNWQLLYYLYLAFILVLGLLMLLLPDWWWVFVHCQTLSSAISARGSDGGRAGLELPFLSGLSTVVRSLLPQSPESAEVRNLDAPFQQEELKRLLRSCVAVFRRIVILIDDVDVLPSAQFAQFLQVLRPMTKVDDVRCVVCVPKYFYQGFSLQDKSDLHSTAQQCRLVGDPRFTPDTFQQRDWDEAAIAVLKSDVRHIVLPLLKSRCRVRVASPERSIGLRAIALAIWSVWDFTADPPNAARINRVFAEQRPSRRELLRETQRLLRLFKMPECKDRNPFNDQTALTAEQTEKAFETEKQKFFAGERALVEVARKPPTLVKITGNLERTCAPPDRWD